MAEMLLARTLQGTLAPTNDEDAERIRKFKAGATVRCQVTQMRNWKLHKKWFVLANYAFDIFKDTCEPMEYRGQPVQPCFERFRKDLTIMAGHFHPVFNARGEMRVEANSLSWGKMSEPEFEALYSATIDAILGKVLSNSRFTDDQLRNYVDTVMSYDS